jgi:hypothetical protein
MHRYGKQAWHAESANVVNLSSIGGGKTELTCAIDKDLVNNNIPSNTSTKRHKPTAHPYYISTSGPG